jgi:pimeloyl-ACP methyl ester carboxylesterase
MPKADVDGIQLSYTDSGHGVPFLLLPGTGENKEYWHAYQVPFFQRYYRVITLDQRDIGESDRPGTPFETRDLARDAIALLTAIGCTEPAHVLGHSMGGRTAQWMALDYPDRVRTLTLVSSGSGQYDPNKPVDRCLPIWQITRMIEMGFEAYVRDNMSGRLGFTDAFRAAHPDIPERLFQLFLASRPSVQAWLLYTAARQRHETTDRLPDIKQPTHVIVGKEDTVMGGTSFHPASSQVLATLIPNATLSTVEGAHHIFWEHPDATNELIHQFLSRHQEVP